ncbi:MAG: 30S ribosomal protein S7 [Fimbriimonadales bacterium]
MPRRAAAQRRRIPPDPVYGNEMVQRFINRLMLRGKKSVAEKITYTALKALEERTGKPAIEVFERALANVTPQVEVRSRRVGGQTYQVPVEVNPLRKRSLTLRWLITFARKRSGKNMVDKLTAELLDAYNNTGAAVKKREDTHRMADANKAFAHYKW